MSKTKFQWLMEAYTAIRDGNVIVESLKEAADSRHELETLEAIAADLDRVDRAMSGLLASIEVSETVDLIDDTEIPF